jgi:hypothetical protein
MKNTFIYDASIADKLERKKQGVVEQNSGTFSTVSLELLILRGVLNDLVETDRLPLPSL